MYQVISEGFRKGIVPQTARECTKAWKIPGDNFVIPKGMNVIIPSVRIFPVKDKGTKGSHHKKKRKKLGKIPK